MKKYIALAVTITGLATSATAEFYEPNEVFSPEQIKMISQAYDESVRVITPETAYEPNEAFSPKEGAAIKRVFSETDRADILSDEQLF